MISSLSGNALLGVRVLGGVGLLNKDIDWEYQQKCLVHYPIPNNDLLSFNSCNVT